MRVRSWAFGGEGSELGVRCSAKMGSALGVGRSAGKVRHWRVDQEWELERVAMGRENSARLAGRADRHGATPNAELRTPNPGVAPIDPRRLARIRWRCRRGLLENDLILTRFLEARGGAFSEADLVALDRLLDLSDNELWDVLAGRAEPPGPETQSLVRELRAL